MPITKVLISQGDALREVGAGRPTQGANAGGVHELAGGAVGLGGVQADFAAVPEDLADGMGQVGDAEIRTVTHVEETALVPDLHGQKTGFGQIIHEEKFPQGRPTPPEGNERIILGMSDVNLAYQSR